MEPAEATAKRRLFNPFRSLKKKLFGHRGRKSDTDAVTASGGRSDVLAVRLTPDVTTSSSTDATTPAEHADESARSETHHRHIFVYSVVVTCNSSQ